VMSCDAYEDLWRPFFTLFQRHWPDCPFTPYLGIEAKKWFHADLVVLRSNAGGRNWSGRLIEYLNQLQCDYVLLMLDDFFLRRSVSTICVNHCLDFARHKDAASVRLIRRPGPTHRLAGEEIIGECAAGLPYRLCTQAAIWNRHKLLAVLRPGESIWEFEHNGNGRIASEPHGFFSVWRPVLPYEGFFAHHVIEKGKWFPHEKRIFLRQKIGCDFSRRGTLSWTQTLCYQAAHALDRGLGIFPWKTKARLKRALKRILRPVMHKQFSRMSGKALPES